MAIVSGTLLGAYKILAPLGAGGMGEVYRARDTRLDREVAIKVLPAEFAQDVDRLQRFEQEAKATSALNHINILTVYDFGTHESSPYLVMELLTGEEPRDLTELNSKVSPQLEKIVRRCLEKKPERRFQTASDLGFALETLTTTSGARLETATLPPTTAPRAGNARLAWWVAAALLLGMIGFAWAYFTRQPITVAGGRFQPIVEWGRTGDGMGKNCSTTRYRGRDAEGSENTKIRRSIVRRWQISLRAFR